ncbi:WXG100 family type VII secretion target [Paenibacillus xylanexedens]|uniref:CdiA C-terminal domain-containing protein n=1 Tax=Paenibacillus xylanexedens TaxID=528191 RepID=UPI0011A8FBC6|nr:WXG100 family type VII secretion target [Paenibacillus xylanexedens]
MNPPFDSNQTLRLLKFRYNYYGQVGGEDGMQRIQVHPDVLDEKARLVQQKKLELDRLVRELEKSIYMLQSEWSGVTGERFFWDFMQVKEVFPTTLGLLDKIQNEFTFIARNFRTTDGSGEVALYIPEELKRNFAVGLLDKSIGETITGMGQTAEAFFSNPFSTLSSVAYAMTVGKVVDVGRGIQFAWDTAWGTGTARSDIEQFVEEQKKQIDESGAGYYGGAMTGQALAYVLFGKALRSMDDIGSGGSKPESGKGKAGIGKNEIELTRPSNSPSSNATPKGYPAKIRPQDDKETVRGRERENEAAKILAEKGYDITQSPQLPGQNKKPDYLIEGNVFDCFSPKGEKSPRNIWSKLINEKLAEGQANRFVVNLDDWSGDVDILKKQFNDWPAEGLEEIIAIKNGKIINIYP